MKVLQDKEKLQQQNSIIIKEIILNKKLQFYFYFSRLYEKRSVDEYERREYFSVEKKENFHCNIASTKHSLLFVSHQRFQDVDYFQA